MAPPGSCSSNHSRGCREVVPVGADQLDRLRLGRRVHIVQVPHGEHPEVPSMPFGGVFTCIVVEPTGHQLADRPQEAESSVCGIGPGSGQQGGRKEPRDHDLGLFAWQPHHGGRCAHIEVTGKDDELRELLGKGRLDRFQADVEYMSEVGVTVVVVRQVGHRQQHVAIVECSSEVVRAGGHALGCSQFDAERQATDQLDDGVRIGWFEWTHIDSLREAVDEQSAGVREPRAVDTFERERFEDETPAAGHVQRHPARGEHVDQRCVGGDPLDERRWCRP